MMPGERAQIGRHSGALFSLTIISIASASAADLNAQKDALDTIADIADRVCTEILVGGSRKWGSCPHFTQNANPSGTSFNNTGPAAATTYRYQVRAADMAGNLSAYSAAVAATTQGSGRLNSNFSSINVLDFGRNLAFISSPPVQAQAYDWFVKHVDVAEQQTSSFKSRDPHMKNFVYQLDITTCQHVDCIHTNADESWLDTVPEEYFLHFSEDTSAHFVSWGTEWGRVMVPGCPAGPVTKACRVQTNMWNDSRYVFNAANLGFRTWMARRLLAAANAQNADGVFLDEHGPGFRTVAGLADGWTVFSSGGGIREYDGTQPSSAMDQRYNDDLSGALAAESATLGAAGKFLMINTGTYAINPQAISQSISAKGAYTENWWKPDSFDGNFDVAIVGIKSVTDAGGMMTLGGVWGGTGPIGYTAGNYSSPVSRYRMWRLAGYYIVKEASNSPGVVYFDPGLGIDFSGSNPLSFFSQWETAYETDLGIPLGFASVYTTGPSRCYTNYQIFARDYSNALVLLRPRDAWDCQNWSDAATVILPLPMQMLRADGALAPATNSVVVRNGEAVIMMK